MASSPDHTVTFEDPNSGEANGSTPTKPSRPVRPRITLPIIHLSSPNTGGNTPNMIPLSGMPLTPVGGVPATMLFPNRAYQTKASEFMFKRFEGFKDFTLNTAKSGLSVGEKFAFWSYGKLRVWSRNWFTHIFLFLVVMAYTLLGAMLFVATEGASEEVRRSTIQHDRYLVIRRIKEHVLNKSIQTNEEFEGLAYREVRSFEEKMYEFHKYGESKTSRKEKVWSFWNAVFYCGTIYTTIGYGDISPTTITGQAITIVYAIFGIPMFLILLTDFGKLFTRGIKFLWAFVRRLYYTGSCRKVRRTGPVQEVMKGVQFVYEFATNRRPSQMDGEVGPGELGMHMTSPPLDGSIPGTPALSNFEVDDEFNLPISVAVVVLLIYIFLGATIFYIWEKWNFFESFYFVFISMSTIGFGDFVPQHPVSMILSIVYLVFGLALTSMCINVVQEKLSASFQQASAKIGATIGLRLAQEEEAAMTPAPPPEVELPEVHQPSPNMKKSQST